MMIQIIKKIANLINIFHFSFRYYGIQDSHQKGCLLASNIGGADMVTSRGMAIPDVAMPSNVTTSDMAMPLI